MTESCAGLSKGSVVGIPVSVLSQRGGGLWGESEPQTCWETGKLPDWMSLCFPQYVYDSTFIGKILLPL